MPITAMTIIIFESSCLGWVQVSAIREIDEPNLSTNDMKYFIAVFERVANTRNIAIYNFLISFYFQSYNSLKKSSITAKSGIEGHRNQ